MAPHSNKSKKKPRPQDPTWGAPSALYVLATRPKRTTLAWGISLIDISLFLAEYPAIKVALSSRSGVASPCRLLQEVTNAFERLADLTSCVAPTRGNILRVGDERE
jgi:hypothetical protein